MVPRSDFGAGGLALIHLSHPLLPEFDSGRLSAEGVVLGPEVARPETIGAPLPPEARIGFLLRLLGLTTFLKSQGLGIAPVDVLRIGSRAGERERARPALAAPPRPEWQSASPALVLSVTALRIAGIEIAGATAAELRRAVERALGGSVERQANEIALSALNADDAGRKPESLLAELALRYEASGMGPDLLGLVFPCSLFLDDALGATFPASFRGGAALYLARGALRRFGGERSFFELTPGTALEEGSALARAARALEGDQIAADLLAWSRGENRNSSAGPGLALLARDADRWDPRSRQIWAGELGGSRSVSRFETRGSAAAPWENGAAIEMAFGTAEVSTLLWLPFPTLANAVASWEAVARGSGGDPARFLLGAARLAEAFEPARPGGPALRTVFRAARRGAGPELAITAILDDLFPPEEAEAVSGLDSSSMREVLDRALTAGRLSEERPGRFQFVDQADRARVASRLSRKARRDAVARLARLRPEPARFVPAALARANPEDLEAARALFRRAYSTGDVDRGLSLLRRAEGNRIAGSIESLLVFSRRGTSEEAQRAAETIEPSVPAPPEPLSERLVAARFLVKAGFVEKALSWLDPSRSSTESLATIQVLLDAHRTDQAGALLIGVKERSGDFSPAEYLQHALLSAEWHERRQDYVAAAAELKSVARLLDRIDSSEVARQAAATAGFLASDLGRSEEAFAFFRRAREEATTDGTKAEYGLDLSVVALHAGRFDVARSELETALALFAAESNPDRYVSALANRAELALMTGDFAAARADLSRVTAHDRAPGREHQFLFAVPACQRIALYEGDFGGAGEWFTQAASREATFRLHPARREALVLEASRLLHDRDPEGALALLDEAGAIPDNRMNNEPLRLRLLHSARLDAGRPFSDLAGVDTAGTRLLRAEPLLASGRSLPLEARRELEARLERSGADAALVCWQILEWAGRFAGSLESGTVAAFVELGLRSAARAGLPEAAARLHDLRPAPARSEVSPAPDPLPSSESMVAEDPAMKSLLGLIAKVAPTALPILIVGESGTGKELIAQAVHRQSGRRGKFVALNVAALSSTLVESELFGHVRGAFTGADRDRIGFIEASSGGTLFLDEIGDLPLPAQAKLLRVLQEREVSRVGETRTRRVDLRVVAATHRDLTAMSAAGSFRFDLLQRLKGFEAHLPPLRERRRDLERLIARSLRNGAALSPQARRVLLAHPWPGNVRELLAVMESASVFSAPEKMIQIEHLPLQFRAPELTTVTRGTGYRDAVNHARRSAIGEALDRSLGNRTHAARLLGLSRQSLLYEIKKLKL